MEMIIMMELQYDEKNDKNGNGSSDKSTKGNDGTTANKKLSQTGYASILPVGVILISFVVISFIKYKKNNNYKKRENAD